MSSCIISVSDFKIAVCFGEDPHVLAKAFSFDGSILPVILQIDSSADFRIRLTSPYSKNIDPTLIKVALSYYFYAIRGLPHGAVELVGERGENYEILDTGADIKGVRLAKCKETVTKTVDFCDGVSLSFADLDCGVAYRCLLVSNTECLDPSVLLRLRAPMGHSFTRFVLGVSQGEPHSLVLPFDTEPDFGYISAALRTLHYLFPAESELRVTVGQREICARVLEGELYLPVRAEFVVD